MARNQKQQRRPDVPVEHHVARHCNFQCIDHDPLTGAVRGLFPAAFELKTAKKEPYLSLNWFEYFDCDLSDQYKRIVVALKAKRNVPAGSAIARLNAGDIMDAGAARSLKLRLRDRSSDSNPAYVGLEGMPMDNSDETLIGLLVKACLEIRKVGSI